MKKNTYLLFTGMILAFVFVAFLFITASNEQELPLNNHHKAQPEIIKSPLPPDENQVLLNNMTLKEKIGQLLIIGYREPKPTEATRKMIQEQKVGGFILFKRNYEDIDSMVQVINQLNCWNNHNPLPLFLSVDEEGGTVSRLPKGGTKFPDARLLGKIDDENLTFQMGAVIGKELRALGINLNYAPVLDIVTSPHNKLLIRRAFGNTPETVAKHGTAFIKGLQSQGVIAAPKHFPGHGDTTIDSHGKLPKIMVEKNTLMSRELIPFISAIDAGGIDAIMAGHLSFPLIDPTGQPATRSTVLLNDLLRKVLDYDGLIITDEIEMIGYMNKSTNLQDAIIQSIHAGVDIFVVGHTHDIQQQVCRIIENAVVAGMISEERINESVMRIIKVKKKYHLSENTSIDIDHVKKVVGSNEHKQVLWEIKKHFKN